MPTLHVPILQGIATVEVRWNCDSAVAALHALRNRTAQRTPLWNAVGSIYRGSFKRSFESGGRPAWAPLKPSTVAKKTKFLSGKPSPPYTKAGKVPPRLLQNGAFGPETKLIERGGLRDSYVQKGAKGHVEEIGTGGGSLLIGSQYTVERELSPLKPIKHYHILTKKALKQRAKGQSAAVMIPIARFHQEGTKRMVARQVVVVLPEDTAAVAKAARDWILGKQA